MPIAVRTRLGRAVRVAVAAVTGFGLAATGVTAAGAQPVSAAASSTADTLWGVAATSQSGAWAVGTRYIDNDGAVNTLIEHWNGTRWSVVSSPDPEPTGTGTENIVDAVAADSADDAWAVGNRVPAPTKSNPVPAGSGLIEHWNGTAWSVVPGPATGGHTTDLSSVAAKTPTQVWALGTGSTGGKSDTVFMRWSGSSWKYLPSPGAGFGGLTVLTDHDIWVMGATGSKSAVHTVAENWNGSTWTAYALPRASSGGKIRATTAGATGAASATSIWAGGSYQSGPESIEQSPVIEHWNGAKWNVQATPQASGSPVSGSLLAVAVASPSAAWAVGVVDLVEPLIEGWNGTTWTSQAVPLQSGTDSGDLNDVAATGPDDAWAVGSGDGSAGPITLIEHWNGTAWSQVTSPSP